MNIAANSVHYDKTVLTSLRKKLAELPNARAHVGLFSNKAQRSVTEQPGTQAGETPDNPSLGFIHEYGSTTAVPPVPERSFLRAPLMLELNSKRLSTVDWIKIIQKRGIVGALKLLGVMGEQVVQEAFATRGFGRWKPLAASTIAKKGSTAILIESGEMRQALSSRVVKS